MYLPGEGCTCQGAVYLVLGRCTSQGVYLPGGGVYLVLGECTYQGCTCQGVYLLGVYLPGVYLVPGGVHAKGCTWSQDGVPGPRGCTCQGAEPGPGGVPAREEVYLVPGGVPGPGEYLVRYSSPSVNRMTNWCKNITLLQTSFAGGNNFHSVT